MKMYLAAQLDVEEKGARDRLKASLVVEVQPPPLAALSRINAAPPPHEATFSRYALADLSCTQ